MTHYMKLKPFPFEMIKSGNKTIELRLFDEKRQKISLGDSIEFTNTQTCEVITSEVIALHLFDSFRELYESLPLLKCGYTLDNIDTAHYSDMNEYYSKDEQEKYGVLGIELSLTI
ncbi:MAG: ASCH domain-containing protein [Clostridia bacterium]|nr:ASCH domain-containing protein [Clostridia bacterium]